MTSYGISVNKNSYHIIPRGGVWIHKINLTPPLFIEVSVKIKESVL
jgi:hypothetical protein